MLIAVSGSVCATVWGANAIRSVASYGLGTGVPSIGYMTLSIGIIGFFSRSCCRSYIPTI